MYKSRLSRYIGITKTDIRLKQYYNFLGLRKKVKEVIKDYNTCRYSKTI